MPPRGLSKITATNWKRIGRISQQFSKNIWTFIIKNSKVEFSPWRPKKDQGGQWRVAGPAAQRNDAQNQRANSKWTKGEGASWGCPA